MTGRRPGLLLVLAGVAAGAYGCSTAQTVTLRGAMGRVQEYWVRLFDQAELGSSGGSRSAADALRDSLASPDILRSSLYRAEDEFREFHAEALETVAVMTSVADDTDRDTLLVLRSEIASACNDCHDRYRPR